MAECEDWVGDGGLLSAVLMCNTPGCPHKVGPSQPMVCDCCAAKEPPLKISYRTKSGPDVFACGHEVRAGDFGFATGIFGCCYDTSGKCPDCLGWERPPMPTPRPIKDTDFTKFTMPVIRPRLEQAEE